MSLQWSEEYATGVASVDDQHRHLFGLVNDLERRLKAHEPAETLVEILKGLARYTEQHFCDEEAAMDRHGCSTACVNKLAHQRFSRLVRERCQELERSNPERAMFEHLHREVTEWLKDHICRIDVKLRDSVKVKSGVAARA